MNSTATNHDAISAMPTTQKMPPAYSPVAELARPIGRKPAAVTSVPVSIGNAVEVQAKEAARSRSQPCSSFTTIISTAMIASSTSRPSAMISAPSVIALQIEPEHRHRDEHDREHERNGGRDDHAPSASRATGSSTPSTIASASRNERVNSNTAASTTLG